MIISRYIRPILILPALFLGLSGQAMAGHDGKKAEIPVITESAEARVLFEQGQKALDRGFGAIANPLFKQATEIDPDFASAWLGLAGSGFSFAEFSDGSRKALEASKGKNEAVELMAAINMSFVNNDGETRLELAKALVEQFANSPRALVAASGAYGSLNQVVEARKVLNKAIKLDPAFYPAHTGLGFSYIFGEPTDAAKGQESLRNALNLDLSNDNAWSNLGDSYRAAKNLEEARKAYSKATELNDENATAFVKSGHVNSFLGNYAEARRAYVRSVEVAPTQNKSIFANYGAFTHVHEGKPAGAIAELEEILEAISAAEITEAQKTGQRIFALSNLTTIALHNEMFDVAESAIERLGVQLIANAEQVGSADQMLTQRANVASWQGRLAARRGDFALARQKAAENADILEPVTNPRKMEPYHNLMGLIALGKGNFTEAVAQFEQADHRNTMYIRYHLGLALAGAGEEERAKEAFTEAGLWNFNSVGFALMRKDALKRAGLR
jgi:tetratricopeptide (TPR) repeat protein